MCGLPGGYPDDLIDVDLDALEGPEADGVIRVSNADYLARPLRLTPTEATAVIVALRALRSGAGDETREVVDRALAKLEAAAAEGGGRAPQVDPGDGRRPTPTWRCSPAACRAPSTRRRRCGSSYYVPSRDEESERVVDPRGLVTADGLHLPRRLVPQRRGAAAVPARPDRRRRGARHPVDDRRRGARATSADGFFAQSDGRHPGHAAARARRPAGSPSTTRSRTIRPRPDGGARGRPAGRRRALADPAAAAAGAARARSCQPPAYADAFTAAAQRRTQPVPLTPAYDGHGPHRPTDEDAHDPPHDRNAAGTPSWLMILAIVVLLFGAAKLPELARGSGRRCASSRPRPRA